ncbi:CHAT domain-containing protein [Candidatus Poribacteria bacterium]|nr:CHAT domain-containing protein [Candidatus Poribacteria bacterium]
MSVTKEEELSNTGLDSERQAEVTIICDKEQGDTPYVFTVYEKSGGPMEGGRSNFHFTDAKAQSFLNRIIGELTPILRRGFHASQLEPIMMQIQGIGLELYEQLIPRDLTDFMKSLPEGAVVTISTKDMWIPWEIIFDETDFWGLKFDLRRLPKLPLGEKPLLGESKLNSAQTRQRLAPPDLKKVVNIVGDELTPQETVTAKTTFDTLQATHGFNLLLLENEPIHTLRDKLRDADVSHFTCHGVASDSGHYLRLGSGQEHRLTVQSVRLFRLDGGLVFANACCSAASSWFLGNFMSFGWTFYRVGAQAFIGTLVPVPTKYALEFAQKFYKLWLVERQSCGKTLRSTKISMSNSNNPFWLFYCLYECP